MTDPLDNTLLSIEFICNGGFKTPKLDVKPETLLTILYNPFEFVLPLIWLPICNVYGNDGPVIICRFDNPDKFTLDIWAKLPIVNWSGAVVVDKNDGVVATTVSGQPVNTNGISCNRIAFSIKPAPTYNYGTTLTDFKFRFVIEYFN